MARPQKAGLDYFPLDVDIDQDDKVALVEAQHGVTGFGVVVKLFMKIYKEGYFYKWTKKEQLLFSSRVNVDINSIREIVNDCIEWDLFDGQVFKEYEVLTSKGIQKRYIEAVTRRKEVTLQKEYLLINPNEYIGNSKTELNIINADIKRVNVDINSNSTEENADNNPQSKVKESKEEKSKGKKPSPKFETCDMEMANRLYSLILENDENFKKPNLENWANEIRLIRERDGRTEEQIRYLIDWTQQDSFWKSNILSPAKLRKQFNQLVIRVKEDIKKQNQQNQANDRKPKAYQSLQDWADEA